MQCVLNVGTGADSSSACPSRSERTRVQAQIERPAGFAVDRDAQSPSANRLARTPGVRAHRSGRGDRGATRWKRVAPSRNGFSGTEAARIASVRMPG